EDRTQRAGVADDGKLREGLQKPAMAGRDPVYIGLASGVQEEVETGEGSGTGEGIGGEGRSGKKRLSFVVAEEGLQQPLRSGGDAEGHGAAGESLAQTDNICFLLQVFPGKAFAGTAQAGA